MLDQARSPQTRLDHLDQVSLEHPFKKLKKDPDFGGENAIIVLIYGLNFLFEICCFKDVLREKT